MRGQHRRIERTVESPCPNDLDTLRLDVRQGLLNIVIGDESRKPIGVRAEESEVSVGERRIIVSRRKMTKSKSRREYENKNEKE